MMDYKYNGKIETDIDKNILIPIIVLCTRSGRKIGVINNIKNLKCNHPMGDAGEISFDIYKEVNGIKNIYWDFIKDFKLIFLPTVADRRFRWYEITVNIDESNDTIKHVTGIHANEAELGQLMLYDVEINTENDIARDDYEIITIDGKEYGTVFFNPEHPKASLLHRILSDKASHYSIVHVDDTLKNIQREFSFNGTSIVDALRQTIAQEVGCLFIFGEAPNNLDDNIFHRTLSAYDLMDYCEDCGERGNYTQGICTNCGSKKIKYGYGKDTGIFVNVENLTESISFSSNTDQVKNFFKMGAGDEYMEAAIRNCNPNGSNYLSYFSDEMKEDMSDELVKKLNEYETLYDGYLKDYDIFLPANDVEEYNKLVNKYQDYIKEDIPVMDAVVKGYGELTNYDYNAVNFKDCLQTIMMPASGEVVETTAQEQIEKLTVESMSPIGTEDSSALSLTAANTAVQTYAKVYVDSSRYKIEISDSTYENNIWSGTITVTSLTNDEDTASIILSIEFNNDGAQFLKQKIQKMMEEHKVEDIGDVSFLQEDYTDEELETIFKPKLKKYSLDALSLLDDLCSATMDILADANQGTTDSPYYEEFYHPYWEKRKLIMEEETIREEEIRIVEQVIEDIDTIREDIINTLNMRNYFGDKLYSELMLYRRETEYSNINFISDGLTDSEVIEKAQEYFKRAQKEIIKASTIQHSISCSLYNLFLIPEFRNVLIINDASQIQYIEKGLYIDNNGQIHNISDEPNMISSTLKRFIDLFDSGNWLRIKVDDKVYKLRLINWEIDYENPEELDVEFSDVIYTGDTMSDIASLLSQARTMATSYNTVTRQAEKGNKANQTIQQTQKQGLILNQNKIINDADTQNFVLNSQGALMRAKNDFDDEYSPEQIKLLNKGIYYTNDDWETVKAGLGHFMYYDPETKETKEDYGIIASTIVGQLLLGENLKIYSKSNRFTMGDEGLAITARDGKNNEDLFIVQKDTGEVDEDGKPIIERYIYVDKDGNINITGNSIIINGANDSYKLDDARRVASNYLSADSTGIMIADMRYGAHDPSDPEGRNILLTNEGVDIRNGEMSMANFSDTVRIGREDSSHINFDATHMSAYNGRSIYYDVGDGSTIVTQSYNVDVLPLTITTSNIIEEILDLKINGTSLSDSVYSFVDGSNSFTINDRPPTAIIVEITYTYSDDEGNLEEITQTFNYDAVSISFLLEYDASTIYSVSHSPYTISGNTITISQRPVSGTIITIQYRLTKTDPYFTFNQRNSNGTLGSGSASFGNNTIASGESSFVTGMDNAASGKASFVTGRASTASADSSSAFGIGTSSTALGGMAVGRYNTIDSSKLFSVGNGISSARSNAFSVGVNGNVYVGGRMNGKDGSQMFLTNTYTSAKVSIASGASYNFTLSIRKNGYMPIAFSFYRVQGTGRQKCNIYETNINITENLAIISVTNMDSVARSVNVQCRIFYILSSAMW